MNDNPKMQVTRLDDIERRGRSIPVREHLGIHAFGVNAFTPNEEGTLINEHDETGSGQEELYIVLEGTATFEVEGESFDAPGRDARVRPSGGAAKGDRGGSRPGPRRHTRRGVSRARLG